MNGKMDGERRAASGKRREFLLLRHARGAAADAGQHDALRDLGHRQLASQRGRGGGKSRHAGRERVRDAAAVKPPQLLGERRIDRQIAGLKPRHVVAGSMRRGEFGLDVIERERRGVDDAGARRAEAQQLARHDRAGIEADRTARDQVAATHGDQIGCARSGADEMYGHRAAPAVGADAAIAQVAEPMARRGAINLAEGPAAAECGGLGDRADARKREHAIRMGFDAIVGKREFVFGHDHDRNAEFLGCGQDAGLGALGFDGGNHIERIRRDVRARQCSPDRGFDVGRRRAASASDAGGDHGFVQTHCVTGSAARQPVLPPTAPAREMAMRINSPPSAA